MVMFHSKKKDSENCPKNSKRVDIPGSEKWKIICQERGKRSKEKGIPIRQSGGCCEKRVVDRTGVHSVIIGKPQTSL